MRGATTVIFFCLSFENELFKNRRHLLSPQLALQLHTGTEFCSKFQKSLQIIKSKETHLKLRHTWQSWKKMKFEFSVPYRYFFFAQCVCKVACWKESEIQCREPSVILQEPHQEVTICNFPRWFANISISNICSISLLSSFRSKSLENKRAKSHENKDQFLPGIIKQFLWLVLDIWRRASL